MSKWNKFKLIHKETGLSARQYAKSSRFVDSSGSTWGVEYREVVPVLLDSGAPAIYVNTPYYPYLIILKPSDWLVRMRPAREEEQ